MTPNEKPTTAERDQTDQSLRVEREATDQALGEEQSAIDEIADAVITRARLRADEVLAATRAKTDWGSSGGTQLSSSMKRERAVEDRVLRQERADADEIVRIERADHVAQLSRERDETDKDLLSERTRSDDALAIRDEFLGIVSHDLRNMLNAIVLSAGLIEEGAGRSDHAQQVARQAQRIQRSSARMSRLIGDLIDVASIEAGALTVTREPSDPAQVVVEAAETFQAHATANGVSLAVQLVPPLPVTAFDPARILQVLINLLSNAIKFTPPGGNVTVGAECVGSDLCFTVTDTGPGIPADKLDKIFERFLQLAKNDRRGVGLGLYISKCIVQGHGGRIWVESTLDAGSSFHFALPRPV
jgi:signal transduction histidine kinase